jgi:hypothetical protein
VPKRVRTFRAGRIVLNKRDEALKYREAILRYGTISLKEF